MDWLDSFFPLLLLLIYFLAQARKRGAKRQAGTEEIAAAETPGVQQPRKRTPFQEIIRQIQEAAEQAQIQQQGPAADLATTVAEIPEAILSRPPDVQSPEMSGFHGQDSFEHDQHGFGDANPFSEEAFERKAPSPPPPAHKQGHLDYSPHASIGGTAAPQISGRSRRFHPMIARLRRADGLKEALVMKEILDRPVSRRKT